MLLWCWPCRSVMDWWQGQNITESQQWQKRDGWILGFRRNWIKAQTKFRSLQLNSDGGSPGACSGRDMYLQMYFYALIAVSTSSAPVELFWYDNMSSCLFPLFFCTSRKQLSMPSSLFSQSRPFWRSSLTVWWCTRTPTCETVGTCSISSLLLLGKFARFELSDLQTVKLNHVCRSSSGRPPKPCVSADPVFINRSVFSRGGGWLLGLFPRWWWTSESRSVLKLLKPLAPRRQVLIETLKHPQHLTQKAQNASELYYRWSESPSLHTSSSPPPWLFLSLSSLSLWLPVQHFISSI